MKRILSLVMAVLLFVSTVPISHVAAAADVTKPVFESISVDKKDAGPGDTVKVSVKATDDVAIKSVYLYYKVPGTDRSFSVPVNFNPETSLYEGTVSVASDFAAGLYEVSYIDIRDTSNNQTLIFQSGDYENKFDNGAFTVSGTSGADITKPVFESISVDKKEAGPGDTVKVSVKATDNVAIKSVYLYYKVPGTDRSFSVPVQYNFGTSVYEGTVSVASDSAAGLYEVSYIDIRDTSNNQTLIFQSGDYENKFDNGAFTVSGTSGADITKPGFQSMSVDRTSATFGDQVKVSLKITDDVGIKSVYLYYKVPGTDRSFSVPVSYHPETDAYEGTIVVSSSFAGGVYSVSYVDIRDTSNNQTLIFQSQDYQNKFDAGDFRVFTETNPPTFSSLSIEKKVVESGDSVKFTVEAADDTNLKSAKITLLSPVTQARVDVPLSYNGSSFTGSLSIDGVTEVGDWEVDSLTITDTNENSTVISAAEGTDLSAGDFTVIEGVPALNFRIVSSNETWSNMTVNEDIYILPGARLTINGNVTLTGKVYILGGLRVYGGLQSTGTLIANSYVYGYYTPVDGQGVISGSNLITHMTATNRILSDVPFELYNTPIVSSGGKVSLTGATVPVVSVQINGQNVALKSNGTFRLNDFSIGDSTSLQVKLTDLYGYTTYRTYDVAEIFVDGVTKNSSAVTGRTQANMKVRIFQKEQFLAEGSSDENGYFSIPVTGVVENAVLKFEVINSADEVVAVRDVTVKDITPPEKPVVNGVTDKDSVVTGSAEAGASIKVKDNKGTLFGSGTVAADGAFSVAIPGQKAGTVLTVVGVDPSGNVGEAASVVVSDATGPGKPYVYYDVTDQDTVITGGSEAGAKVEALVNDVVIGSYVADVDGYFSISIPVQKPETEIAVRATDTAGNVGEAAIMVVQDVTAPEQPVVNEVTDKDKVLTGSAEPNALIEIEGGNWEGAYQGRADGDGKFAVGISDAQKAGTELRVYQYDKVYHKSTAAVVTVKDATAPEAPVVHEVTNRDTVVNGKAEAGATVQVAVNGTVIGQVSVRADGTFTVTIPVQAVGAELVVTVTDGANNVSEAASIVVVKAKLAGWVKDSGKWYYYDPATYDVKVGWYKVGSSWYFADGTGAMKTGWVKDGSSWYYMNGSGAMVTGWLKVGTVWYYFNSGGAMVTGWMKSGATWYYFAGSGAMQVGWLKSGTVWYYFNSGGAMVTGWVKIGGRSYYFDSNGVWRK